MSDCWRQENVPLFALGHIFISRSIKVTLNLRANSFPFHTLFFNYLWKFQSFEQQLMLSADKI